MNRLIIILFLLIYSGCSKITEQARLDRFNEKLKVKQNAISKKINKDLIYREKNISRIKQDIKYLKSKIKNSNNNNKIKDSFKRYAKNLESQGNIQLIQYEIEMLTILAEKELKLNAIKNDINKISTSKEQSAIKSLKKNKSKLNNIMENLYIDISWYESVNRINLINAQKSAQFINESNIYAKEGNFIDALDNVNKAKKLTPNIPIIYAQLGSLYYLTGDNQKSLINYKKAMQFNYTINGIEEMISLLENQLIQIND